MGVMYYRQDDGTYVPIGGPMVPTPTVNNTVLVGAADGSMAWGPPAWTNWESVVSQGASSNIARNNNYSKYVKMGRLVIWNFVFALTGGGTAGSPVRITLPVTAAANTASAGSGYVYDASLGTVYAGGWYSAGNTTQIQCVGDWAGNGAWGGTPNVAAASGDYLVGQCIYESAS